MSRFTAAGHGGALPIFLEVLEQEAEDRKQRRINRLRKESRLPSGKTWETFEHDRMPMLLRQQMDQLAQGDFVERGVNVLAFGLPGAARPMPCAPSATAWWSQAAPSSSPRPTGWCRTCWQPSATWPCRVNYASWTPSTSCSWMTWATCPRAPRNPRCSSPSSPNATSAVIGHHLQPGLLRVGAHLRQSHGHRRGHRPRRPPLGHPGIRRAQLPHRRGPTTQFNRRS